MPNNLEIQKNPGKKYEAEHNEKGEGHITILGKNYSEIIQGTATLTTHTNRFLGKIFYTTSTLINDEIHYKVYLTKGTYTFKYHSDKSTTCGIVTVRIDNTIINTYDQYYAGTEYDQEFEETGIVISKSKLYTIKLKVESKNASATAYRIYVGILTFFRTS